jgi:hypothetical protein
MTMQTLTINGAKLAFLPAEAMAAINAALAFYADNYADDCGEQARAALAMIRPPKRRKAAKRKASKARRR